MPVPAPPALRVPLLLGLQRPPRERSGAGGRTVALLAAAAQIVAVFLPWEAGASGLDASLRTFDVGIAQPTVGAALVLLAAVPAVAALVSDVGWPRVVSALGTGVLALAWLARGPSGEMTSGVWIALGAAVGHLMAAAIATGPRVPGPAPRRPGDAPSGASGAPPAGDAHLPEGRASDAPATRGREPGATASGFRHLAHTADTAFEAWGPSRAACFGEAVRALVDSFAGTAGVRATDRHRIGLERTTDDEDLLVDLLDEVIYLVDVRGAVPVGGRVHDRDDGGLEGHLDLAPTDRVRPGGAVPKAITYHGLEVVADEDGWRCRVTVDV